MYYAEDIQESFLSYREWKIKDLIIPNNYNEYFGCGYSGFDGRHQKRIFTYVNDKVGDFRCWKRYRNHQYKDG